MTKVSAGASSLRASDRSGWRFLGQHSGGGHGRETPFVVKGQVPDRQALDAREAQRQLLQEKQAYWEEELATWTEEFGEAALEKLRDWLGKDYR